MGTSCAPKKLKIEYKFNELRKHYSNQLNFLTLIMNQRDYKKMSSPEPMANSSL